MPRAGFTDLTAFVAIAEHRSSRQAAVALNVSPSALSHALRGRKRGWACASSRGRRGAWR